MHYEKFADGSIKCIEDEIPFELPEGWSWCRYSDVIELYSGQDLTPDRYNNTGDGIPYITGASNLERGKVLINRWTTTPTTHATKGDLLLTVKGSGVGKMAFCDIIDAHIARQIMALRCTKAIQPKYLHIAVSAMLSDITAQANGIIPGIRREIVLGTLLPLPPFNEQTKICEKADSSLLIIHTISDEKDDLKGWIDNTKTKIIDLAICGQLVPQDPNDEPASVLLERIRAEKEELIKQGKIKRDKKESIIFKGEDNSYYLDELSKIDLPFDVPDNWIWISHNELYEISGGAQPPKSKFTDIAKENYVRLYQIRDYGDHPIPVYIPKEFATKKTNKGDILLARYGASLGKVFWAEDGAYNVAMAKVESKFLNGILPEYMFYFYHSRIYKECIFAISRTAQAGFNKEDLNSLYIPLPPKGEQKRIVEAIKKIYCIIDDISNTIS